MSKGGGTTTTTSQSSPAPFQMPYVEQMLTEAKKLYGQEGPSYYPTSTVAPFSDAQKTAQQWITNNSLEPMTQQAQAAAATATKNLSASDVTNNPYLAKAGEAATRPIWEQLTEYALPQIRRGYESTGSFGGSRQGIAEGLAMGKASQAAQDALARMYSDAYQQGLGVETNTLGLMPQVQSMIPAAAAPLASVGTQQQQQSQAELTDQVNRWTYNQNLPYQKLAEYANYAKLPLGGYGTSEVKAPEADPAAQWIGGLTSIWPFISDIFGWGS